MSDSEVDASPVKPSDPKIEQCLRGVVSRLHKQDSDRLTVKNVRAAAEKELNLSAGFLKADTKWNARSKQVIQDAVDKLEAGDDASESEDEKPLPEPKPVKEAPAKASNTKGSKRGTKRASSELEEDAKPTEPPKKQRKVTKPSSDDASDLSSPPDDDASSAHEDDEDGDDGDGKTTTKPDNGASKKATPADDDDLSSLSDVRDSPPPKKKRKKSDQGADAKTKSKPAKASKAKPVKDVSPQEAEIKRLQGWLIKCGIRKMWHKELAPFSTDKAKISHLKSMLSGAGMEGRFSEEKAKQIKEKRELAADLEAVQEGNKIWGQSEDEGEQEPGKADGEGQPRRRLAKGLRDITAFLSDGEETD